MLGDSGFGWHTDFIILWIGYGVMCEKEIKPWFINWVVTSVERVHNN